MSGITDGQAVDAAASNAAWLSKNGDDTTVGKVGLANTDPLSGTSVTNAQAEHNSIASFVGKAINGAYNLLPTWASSFIGTGSDSIKARIEAVILKFKGTSAGGGHAHSGADGDGAPIQITSTTGLTSGHILVGNASNVPTDVAMSGDITIDNTGAATIAANAVTNAKAAQMAAHTFKGNNTALSANPIDLTVAQLTAELNAFVGDSGSGGTKGLVPAPAAGDGTTGKFLKADGTWVNPSSSLVFTAPTVQRFIAPVGGGSVTGYLFNVTAANATAGAVYTNNGSSFTVLSTISGGTVLFTSFSGALAPTGSTLTLSSGSGDATITFSSYQPMGTYTRPAGVLYLKVKLVGGGGGGGPGQTSTAAGGAGGKTTFGTALTAGGGPGGKAGAGVAGGADGPVSGGTNTVGAGPIVLANVSGGGGSGVSFGNGYGGSGGNSYFGGGGGAGGYNSAGGAAATNSGGGGGGGGWISGSSDLGGEGGGAGGYLEAIITSPSSTYPYAVGDGGSAGTGTYNGGAGGSGVVIVEEHYQ